jgi:dTDP-4-amino-4,6-dideoxygalactose transaminase
MGSEHVDIVGANYRLGEIEAAIGRVQLARLEDLTSPRIAHAELLTERLGGLEGIEPPHVPEGSRHVYYLYVLRLDEDRLGVSRRAFADALRAEGIPCSEGYVAPLYRQPVYRRRAVPAVRASDAPDYADGTCPVCERMHEHEVLDLVTIHAGLSEADIEDVAAAIIKVQRRRAELL